MIQENQSHHFTQNQLHILYLILLKITQNWQNCHTLCHTKFFCYNIILCYSYSYTYLIELLVLTLVLHIYTLDGIALWYIEYMLFSFSKLSFAKVPVDLSNKTSIIVNSKLNSKSKTTTIHVSMKHLYTPAGWVIPMTVTQWALLIMGFTCLTSYYGVVICRRRRNKGTSKKVNLRFRVLHATFNCKS